MNAHRVLALASFLGVDVAPAERYPDIATAVRLLVAATAAADAEAGGLAPAKGTRNARPRLASRGVNAYAI